MCAVQVEHADAAAAVAEHHQVFPEDSHAQRGFRHVAGKRHRLPEAAEVLAGGRAGADRGQLRIRRRHRAPMVTVEGLVRHRVIAPGFSVWIAARPPLVDSSYTGNSEHTSPIVGDRLPEDYYAWERQPGRCRDAISGFFASWDLMTITYDRP